MHQKVEKQTYGTGCLDELADVDPLVNFEAIQCPQKEHPVLGLLPVVPRLLLQLFLLHGSWEQAVEEHGVGHTGTELGQTLPAACQRDKLQLSSY